MTYGDWPSPITEEIVIEGGRRLSEVQSAGGILYWLEGRPKEKGRTALVKGGEDLLPDVNIGTRVHEYGGGAFCALEKGAIISNKKDGNLYLLQSNALTPLTETSKRRYAKPLLDTARGCVYALMEEGQDNSIVQIDIETKKVKTLASGGDFYSSLALSPDGNSLAYLTWNHPHMPWDATLLIECDLNTGKKRVVAGGDAESINEPRYSPDGTLYFVTDRTGYWNLATEEGLLFEVEAELGEPLWKLGYSRYGFVDRGIVFSGTKEAQDFIALYENGRIQTYETPFNSIRFVAPMGDKVAFVGAGPKHLAAVVTLDLTTGAIDTIRTSSDHTIDKSMISVAEPYTFNTTDGKQAHAFFYPPCNPNVKGPKGERPPLIVNCHGGPSGNASAALNYAIQYWTSRGFAYVDVNYRGSTGFGRAYRDALNLKWGLVDVSDSVDCAKSLAKDSLVDGTKMAIRGSSSGGFTVLCALTFHNVFSAGCSLYGIGDLVALHNETHKFESHYDDTLVGTDMATLVDRSPCTHITKLKTPLLVLQGEDDAVVPKSQAEAIVSALKGNDVFVEYHLYQGEGHGFRKASTLLHALKAERNFYHSILMKK